MLVRLDVAGVHHEPLHVRFVDANLQETFPHPLVAPTAESPVGVLPSAVFGRKVPPGRSRPENPANGVDEAPVVFGDTAPLAALAGADWFDFGPKFVGNVVSVESI